MFLLTQPGTVEISSFLDQASDADLTYPDVRASLDGVDRSTSYNVDHNQTKIGKGEKDFERAKQAIREWKMFNFPWIELCWPSTPIEEDRNVAVLI